MAQEAPGVRLFFLQKTDKSSAPLRDGCVDLETGVIEENTGPEVRSQSLFRDRMVGVVRKGHPLGRGGAVDASTYLKASHVVVSRNGLEDGAVDSPFLPGAQRAITTIVSGFSAARPIADVAEYRLSPYRFADE